MATNGLRHVLDGYKVLDFTQVLAGPTVTRLMAEMGAEIIKVELAPAGDFSRCFPFVRDGRGAYYIQQNRGKKSLCLDVRKPEGDAIVEELIGKVDVLVENYAPGVIKRMGFDYDAVRALNPSITMARCRLRTDRTICAEPGYDYIAQAYAAVTYMICDPNGPPSIPMLGLGDVSTGAHAMGAIVAALFASRARPRRPVYRHLDPRRVLPLPGDERPDLRREQRRNQSQALRRESSADLSDRRLS
jgi:crotonobetainyl-CoA:carnitine CoA-transferase CaiB-like acyl-CoA transferase